MRLNAVVTKLCLSVAACWLAGCSVLPERVGTPRATAPEVAQAAQMLEKVAIVPMVNHSAYSDRQIPFDMNDIFTSELLRAGVNRVVRPHQTLAWMQAHQFKLNTVEDVMELGKELDADMVITLQLTEWDPYNPPKASVAMQVFHTRRNTAKSFRSIDDMLAAGVPFMVNRENNASWPFMAVERVFDASENATILQLKDFLRIHRNKDTSFVELDSYLNVSSKYFHFVSYRLVHELLSEKHALDQAEAAELQTQRARMEAKGFGDPQ